MQMKLGQVWDKTCFNCVYLQIPSCRRLSLDTSKTRADQFLKFVEKQTLLMLESIQLLPSTKLEKLNLLEKSKFTVSTIFHLSIANSLSIYTPLYTDLWEDGEVNDISE